MSETTYNQNNDPTTSEMITVPDDIKRSLAERADRLGAMQSDQDMIQGVPDHGKSAQTARTPDDVVAEINAQLVSRDPAQGHPEVRAGGVDGVITQRSRPL